MEGSREKVLLYLRGVGDKGDLWYRVEFEFTKEKIGILELGERKKIRLPRQKISPVASMNRDDYATGGSWEVIGDDIYWFGGFSCPKPGPGRIVPFNILHKHNINDPNYSVWEELSNSMKIPRISPFLVAIGRNQLCVVGGTEHCPGSDDEGWNKCGEIYDIDNRTWTFIDAEYKDVRSYDTFIQAAVVQHGSWIDGYPKQIVFYSLYHGSTLLLDLPSGSTQINKYARFDLWKREFKGGVGFPHCDLFSIRDFSYSMPAVFINNTFYWYSNRMRLVGYDTKHQVWLQSPSLRNQLPHFFQQSLGQYVVLIGVGVGKLLLIAPQDEGQLTIAPLSVETDPKRNSLTVAVSFLQPLRVDDRSFLPFDGKALLKVEESN